MDQALPSHRPGRSIIALLLMAPAPAVGVLVGLTLRDSPWGPAGWMLCKLWLFGLPAVWHVVVEGGRLSLSPARKGGWAMALTTGLLAALAIVASYLLLGPSFIDAEGLRKTLGPLGLTRPAIYIGAAIYWIAVNSVLEEYVFRWFIVRKCQDLMPSAAAVGASAGIFVAHHAVAMAAYFPWWINMIASVAIFLAGATWSWLYVRYQSIWIPWLSHALADVVIFVIGGLILLG